MRDRWLIDGHCLGEGATARLQVRDPASDQTIASVPLAGAEQAHACVQAASRALVTWRAQGPAHRAEPLTATAEALVRDLDRLARLIKIGRAHV